MKAGRVDERFGSQPAVRAIQLLDAEIHGDFYGLGRDRRFELFAVGHAAAAENDLLSWMSASSTPLAKVLRMGRSAPG
jgi:hypothetical protein